ncbi:MAG TPA: hypothetical protein VN426_12495 [Syntrophomonadaceae bacterium]|nr:hypothetical protein [Syntrophomonadaceae bacterium]
MYSSGDSALAVFFGTMMIVGVIFVLIGIAMYVLKSIGVMKLADKRGLENSWLGWIPIADLYLLGTIVGEMDLFGYKVTNLAMVAPGAAAGYFVLSFIPFINFLAMIAFAIFMVVFLYNLYKMYSDQAVLYTILSVIGLAAIFIFLIRDKEPLNQGNYSPPSQY